MKIEIDGFQYVISWKHNNNGQGQASSTQCILTMISPPFATNMPVSISYTGVAVCKPKDQYSRQVGRKLSLKSTLKPISDKGIRRAIWKAFLGLRNPIWFLIEDSSKSYRIIREVKSRRPDGAWATHILYEALYKHPDGKYFTREKDDFYSRFTLINPGQPILLFPKEKP